MLDVLFTLTEATWYQRVIIHGLLENETAGPSLQHLLEVYSERRLSIFRRRIRRRFLNLTPLPLRL